MELFRHTATTADKDHLSFDPVITSQLCSVDELVAQSGRISFVIAVDMAYYVKV